MVWQFVLIERIKQADILTSSHYHELVTSTLHNEKFLSTSKQTNLISFIFITC